ncbi:hypothetical protein FCL53_10815 [Elizabethkingia meningoseptica]|uniref:hypothetical protein n=1 Tax=Elizabethkingia meningoseptica TaxID=238 RepID=UPI0013667C63|nr:hypothetical protein [Elizabethkingia meningoseptica]MVW92456.1 hypothetical protein [Elizabethkingia meningoseptica]
MYNTIYYIEYFDTENELVRIDIKKKDFNDQPTLIQGSAKLKYEDRKELTKPIIASTLEIDLEANDNLTLNDLYSEDERTFMVECKKGNNKMLFKGFVKPDGIWEDLVNGDWIISIDCIDGLSTLKDLSFVDDSGEAYTGDMCIRDVVYNCLRKIGYDLPINYFINIRLIGAYLPSESFLDKVYMNVIRFYQDSGKSKEMDCESVLKSTLSLFGACIFMHNGEWYIIRMPSYFPEMNFRRYEFNVLSGETTRNIRSILGSDINGYYPHHINANQRKTILPSIQAYRVNLQFGGARSKILNSELIANSTTKIINGWVYDLNDINIKLSPKGGLECKSLSYWDSPQLLLSNEPNKSEVFKRYSINTFRAKFTNTGNSYNLYVNISTNNFSLFKRFDGYYWDNKTSGSSFLIPNTDDNGNTMNNVVANIQMPELPEESYISIKIWKSTGNESGGSSPGLLEIKYLGLVDNFNSDQKGEFYVSQRSKRISTVTKSDATVYNGDSTSNLYYCSLVLSDGSPTEPAWRRQDKPFDDTGEGLEFRPLVSFIPEDALRMNPIPIPSLEGDILGYIPFLNIVEMKDLLEGLYIFTDYSYDTKTCQIKCNMRRFFVRNFLTNREFRDNKFYEVEPDFGEETKVTIKS